MHLFLCYMLTTTQRYLPLYLLTAVLAARLSAARNVSLLSWGACRSTCAWQGMHCNETAMGLLAADGCVPAYSVYMSGMCCPD